MKSVDELIVRIQKNFIEGKNGYGEEPMRFSSLYHYELETLITEIHSLRQRLAEAEAKVPRWQPIESAPKDGTKILGFSYDKYHHNRPAYYGVAEWATKKDYLLNSVAGWFWPYATRPTHWMPLPAPPEGNKTP